jgi:iron-sulfur cluster assembly accessory protein
MISALPNAIDAIKNVINGKNISSLAGLRLAVERGGCAGLQYVMKIAESVEGDEVIELGSGARIFIAADSVSYFQDCQIDYSDSLSDAGFKIINPNATRSCGCGTSFESVSE